MPTRRHFIKDIAGAAGITVGCGLMNAAETYAQAATAVRRREVVVNGRRVKTVDVHAHCAVPEAMALMGRKLETQAFIMGPDRIRAMDEQGIDVEALSINPYWYKADRDLARQLIKTPEREARRGCARPSRTASSPSPRWRCSIRTWPPSSSRRASRSTGCAAPPSAAASTARS